MPGCARYCLDALRQWALLSQAPSCCWRHYRDIRVVRQGVRDSHPRMRCCKDAAGKPAQQKTQSIRGPQRALAGALADLGDVCAGEAVGVLDEQVDVHVGRDGGLAQDRLEDLAPAALVRQGDVDQLVQAPRAQQRAVNDVRPARAHGQRHAVRSSLNAL